MDENELARLLILKSQQKELVSDLIRKLNPTASMHTGLVPMHTVQTRYGRPTRVTRWVRPETADKAAREGAALAQKQLPEEGVGVSVEPFGRGMHRRETPPGLGYGRRYDQPEQPQTPQTSQGGGFTSEDDLRTIGMPPELPRKQQNAVQQNTGGQAQTVMPPQTPFPDYMPNGLQPNYQNNPEWQSEDPPPDMSAVQDQPNPQGIKDPPNTQKPDIRADDTQSFPQRDQVLTSLGDYDVIQVHDDGDMTVESGGRKYVVTTDGQLFGEEDLQSLDWVKGSGLQRMLKDMTRELIKQEVPEGPFAGYKDFEDCVRSNQQASDPEAYCASVGRKILGKSDSNPLEVDGQGLIKPTSTKPEYPEESSKPKSGETEGAQTVKPATDIEIIKQVDSILKSDWESYRRENDQYINAYEERLGQLRKENPRLSREHYQDAHKFAEAAVAKAPSDSGAEPVSRPADVVDNKWPSVMRSADIDKSDEYQVLLARQRDELMKEVRGPVKVSRRSGPPGPPPYIGAQWNPRTHRWHHPQYGDTGPDYAHEHAGSHSHFLQRGAEAQTSRLQSASGTQRANLLMNARKHAKDMQEHGDLLGRHIEHQKDPDVKETLKSHKSSLGEAQKRLEAAISNHEQKVKGPQKPKKG